jgi:hypothetical protein
MFSVFRNSTVVGIGVPVPQIKGKGKIIPVLFNEHHAMKMYWGVEV